MNTRAFATGAVIAILTVALLSGAVGSVAAQDTATVDEDSAFIVALEDNGDATVTLRLEYDLTETDAAAAFEQLEVNTADRTTQYRDRLASVAEQTAAETGREMTITDADMTTRIDGNTGIVTISATWSNLAAVDDEGQLVVTEPFASGFAPDQRFVIVAPDGGAIVETSVSPDTRSTDRFTWEAGTDLSGFSATVDPDGGTSPTPLLPALATTIAGVLVYGGWRRMQ